MEVVLGILFLNFCNANIQFAEKKLTWRSYTTKKTLSTTQKVELINKTEFARAALDEKFETFVVHVADLETLLAGMTVQPSPKAQIAALRQDKAPIEVTSKYAGYDNVFSFDLAMKLPKNTGINKNAIKLYDGKQLPYRSIDSLGPVELETLKTYIETYLKTGFIRPSKFLVSTPILFDKKPDGSVRLCVNY